MHCPAAPAAHAAGLQAALQCPPWHAGGPCAARRKPALRAWAPRSQGGDWEKAWAVFLAMKQAGLRPSPISYNALISACERAGQVDR